MRDPQTMYQGVIRDEERIKAKAAAAAAAKQAATDPDCDTCRLSPAPELHEATSAEARARERLARQVEYDRQAELAKALAK
jgi:protein PET117